MNIVSRLLEKPYGTAIVILFILWVGLSIPTNVYVIYQLKKHIREKTDTEAIWSSVIVFYLIQTIAIVSQIWGLSMVLR